MRWLITHVNGEPKGEEGENETKAKYEEIMAKNLFDEKLPRHR